jgi:hypothetical protein
MLGKIFLKSFDPTRRRLKDYSSFRELDHLVSARLAG